MQTFLPYSDFEITASVLDYRRLGNQRVEARQIINVLEGKTTAWQHHPIVRMWREHTDALKHYFNIISQEWMHRGYKHSMGFYNLPQTIFFPQWLGREDLHLSHQSNLVRKKPECYREFFPNIPDDLPYIWL